MAPALLALADGTVFQGQSIGANGLSVGEVVFNTAMTGYQEILTDPSYSRQIVTLTYPHIGNVGMNADDAESTSIHAAGLVVRDLPQVVSNFRSQQNLADALTAAGIVGIAGIDTRRLTRILREKGAQNGALLAGQVGESLNAQSAIDAAKKFPGLKGMDLAKVVTTPKAYRWAQGSWRLGQEGADGPAVSTEKKFHVVALDFGVKHNILRMLVDRGCAVSVVPAQTTFTEIEALAPDGVFLSNGPGDPEPCDYAIACAKAAMAKRIPLFGICLGHQIMALASGAKTLKMKFGHHGANHPVQDLDTKRVFITSQNHGFAVDPTDLPAALRVTHRSLFDQSIQGLARTDVPAFCFQGHPEASPGPHDIGPLFDRFITIMRASSAQAEGSRA
ncbi:MAG: glutamine-hydrolyzing carbamoyl-phosphate synthase small subunit [Betaproteobacteria bacterium]|nr:glutamine-hydrolyzing carbamoyl-phosphate synthase small subunit [Betaproteobacteria bacterium]